MNREIAASVLVGVLGVAGSARAEGEDKYRFGSPGVIISADRLLPLVSYESVKTTQADGSSDTQSRLSIALLNNGPFGVFGTFYNLPRVGFDWVPVQNVTIGGSAWLYAQLLATDSLSPATGGSKPSTDQPKVTYWGVAPRIGYIIPISKLVSLWPRAGVEYHHVSSSSGGSSVSPSVTQFALGAEALVVISTWSHFGFTVGPTVDVPITGESTSTASTGTGTSGAAASTSVDSAMFQIGASAGFLGHF